MTSQSTSITEAVRFVASTRILNELSSKITSEFGAKMPGFSGKLAGEVAAKTQFEMTATMEQTLSTTKSFLVQEIQGQKETIELKESSTPLEASIRRKYWPRRWDIFLHSFEQVELKYERTFLWRTVRDNMKQSGFEILGIPLASVLYYEPQPEIDVITHEVAEPLNYPEEIKILPLGDLMPDFNPPGGLGTLESFAKLAFPSTSEEKRAAKLRKALKKKDRHAFVSRKTPARRRKVMKASKVKAVKKTLGKAKGRTRKK